MGIKSSGISLEGCKGKPLLCPSLFPKTMVGGVLSLPKLQSLYLTFLAHLVFHARRLMLPEVNGSRSKKRTCLDESGLLLIFHLLYFFSPSGTIWQVSVFFSCQLIYHFSGPEITERASTQAGGSSFAPSHSPSPVEAALKRQERHSLY